MKRLIALFFIAACSTDDASPALDAAVRIDAGFVDDVLTVDIHTVHSVWQMDVVEVTQARYARFLGCDSAETCAAHEHAPCEGSGFAPDVARELPVVCVTHAAAGAYCRQTGKRLCTFEELLSACEATWERIGGGPSLGPDDTDLCVLSGFDDGDWGAPSQLEPVRSAPECRGAFAPFSKVYDVVGNAPEWSSICPTESCDAFTSAHSSGPGHPCIGVGFPVPAAAPHEGFQLGFRCCADGAAAE